jgi:hypothetical protein
VNLVVGFFLLQDNLLKVMTIGKTLFFTCWISQFLITENKGNCNLGILEVCEN